MRRLTDIALFAAAAGLVLAITVWPARSETIAGDRIVIIDGDTVTLPCDPVHGVYPGCAERVRLVGIDAPETYRPRCDAERGVGLKAKAALATALRGQPVTIERTGRDGYGRTLGRLITPSGNVEAPLLASGLAIPYEPGREAWQRRLEHWCGRGR
jgi:endonuclease YncB( thermonuclease family)